MDRLLTEVFLEAAATAPERTWLDLDATYDPVHWGQQGRFFHGYYRHYCYLPLYIFCGDHPSCARLRASDIDASAGSVSELERTFGLVRARWPNTEIVIRGDSGFCREAIMAWCETEGVQYLLGLAKNVRLKSRLAATLVEAEALYENTGQAARIFNEWLYRTRKSWSRERRVINKAEYLAKGPNPCIVVTTWPREEAEARPLYVGCYRACGDMQNRIKEQ